MLKDQTLAEQVYNSINTAVEAENELLKYASENNIPLFSEVSDLLYVMLDKISGISGILVKEEPALSLDKAIASVIDSLNRIISLMKSDRERALKKIEYELIPLTEECRINFYFWGIVSGDKEKEEKYLNEDIYELARNKYIENSVRTGEWKYDLSITVLAYNKLDYTRKCISYLMKYYPRNLRTELILINHGSDDGTKEFFESINPDKQLDIKVNGGGLSAISRIVEGKYTVSISNDVFIQRNTIKNLYECIISDPEIGYIVPSTPNVSNYQAIPCNYSNEEELEEFCRNNNIPNADRREQRTRLCDPIGMINSEIIWKLKHSYRYYSKNSFSFPDDNFSLLCRRSGYKMFLVKDAYCHHCGSVTLKEDRNTNSAAAYLKGRNDFKKRYGIDPWFKCAYSYNLFQNIAINKTGPVNILAVNGGLGNNGLKIKELLKENVANRDVFLKYFLTDILYFDDVKYLGDCAVVENSIENLAADELKYDYMVVEDIEFKKETINHIVGLFLSKCNTKAMLIIEAKCSDKKIIENNISFDEISGIITIPDDEKKMWVVISIK